MNRRDLFKFMGIGAAGLLVPELVLPKTTYFLSPRSGWADPLKIRILEIYIISDDSTAFEYDATWDSPTGATQYTVDLDYRDDAFARKILYERMYADHGTANSSEFRLALPRGGLFGDYLT